MQLQGKLIIRKTAPNDWIIHFLSINKIYAGGGSTLQEAFNNLYVELAMDEDIKKEL